MKTCDRNSERGNGRVHLTKEKKQRPCVVMQTFSAIIRAVSGRVRGYVTCSSRRPLY